MQHSVKQNNVIVIVQKYVMDKIKTLPGRENRKTIGMANKKKMQIVRRINSMIPSSSLTSDPHQINVTFKKILYESYKPLYKSESTGQKQEQSLFLNHLRF